MGSMTGAPERKVMQLIEQYEKSRRGLFSGAVGYIAPGGDFDFNVVIRSILYNATATFPFQPVLRLPITVILRQSMQNVCLKVKL